MHLLRSDQPQYADDQSSLAQNRPVQVPAAQKRPFQVRPFHAGSVQFFVPPHEPPA